MHRWQRRCVGNMPDRVLTRQNVAENTGFLGRQPLVRRPELEGRESTVTLVVVSCSEEEQQRC
jgi:hypothetical protein